MKKKKQGDELLVFLFGRDDRILNHHVRRLFAEGVFSSCAHVVKLLRNLRGSESVNFNEKRKGQ